QRAACGAGIPGRAGARLASRTDARGAHAGVALCAPYLGAGRAMKAPAAVLLAGLLLGQTVQYVRTKTNAASHCLRWPVSAGTRGTIHYVQSTTGDPTLGSGVFDAVSRSGQTWQTQLQACGNLDLVESSPHSTSRFVGYNQSGPNENLVLFRLQLCSPAAGDPCIAAGNCGNTHDCWDHGTTVVALTTSPAASFSMRTWRSTRRRPPPRSSTPRRATPGRSPPAAWRTTCRTPSPTSSATSSGSPTPRTHRRPCTRASRSERPRSECWTRGASSSSATCTRRARPRGIAPPAAAA